MQTPHPPKIIRLDQAAQFQEWDVRGSVSGRGQARLVGSATPWGGAVIRFHGSVQDEGEGFHEIDTTVSIDAEEISAKLDLAGVRRLRAVVTTASTTVGARAEVAFCTDNPYLAG